MSMLRYILRFWIWYVQDLLAEFCHRESAEQTKGPLLWNGYASLRGRRRSLDGSSCSPDYPCHTDQIMLANDAFVRRVEWWKKGDWPYHETLVFYVQERHQSDGKTPRKSVFLAERNITGNTDHPERNIGEPLLINFYEDAGGTVLTNSPPPEPQVQGRLLSVVDTVTHPMGVFTRAGKASNYTGGDMMTFSADGTNAFIHSMPEEKFLCRTLTIHGEYLSVPEVAVLIRVVHDYHRSDKFKVYQSFWFAHTIYTSIQTIIQDSARNMALATSVKQSRSRVSKDETRHTKLKVGQFQQGTKKYYVKQGGPDLPSKVYAEYLAAWDDMKKQIATRVNDIEEEFRERVRQKFVEGQIKARDEETKALEEKARKLEEVLEMLKGQDALAEKTESIEEKNHKLEEELEILRRQYAPGPSRSSQDTPVTLAAS